MLPIYCIMITGKDDNRIEYAKKSVKNFLNQTHGSKILIIMNHNNKKVLEKNCYDNIFEFPFDIEKINLGDARNIALNLVAIGALWTTWDDDDIRSNEYLELLYANLNHDHMAVAFKKRIDYYTNTNFSQLSTMENGFVTLLCRKDPRIKYLSKQTMEDLDLKNTILKYGKINVIDNDPLIYIRIVHSNNTSLYVNKEKKDIINYNGVYKEYMISQEMQKTVNEIMRLQEKNRMII